MSKEYKIFLSERASKILDDFKEGSGYSSDDMVIQEALFAIAESLDAYTAGNPRKVEGILSVFTRFKS